MSQERAPLFEELKRYAGQSLISFHTPGHKAGLGLEAEWGASGFPAGLDLTEIPGFNWARAWERAQELAADFYQADETFFLSQGASQGVIGGILGAFSPGDTVLVGRNCHSSVIKGIILAGLNPIYIPAEFLPEFNIPVGINPASLTQWIKEFPGSKGLIVTNPSYQGVAGAIKIIREIIGDRLLFVDEAHGGHFGWLGMTEYDACHYADIWVHGTHKIFGSLTQTGLLHLKKGRIDPQRIKINLDLITTTSPSYILLASLDSNRRYLAMGGAQLFLEKLPEIEKLRDSLVQLNGLQILTTGHFTKTGRIIDPWKICIQCRHMGLTGSEVETILRQKYQIQAEYADESQVTFLAVPWQTGADLDRLKRALGEISVDYNQPEDLRSFRDEDLMELPPDYIPPLMMQPRDAKLKPGKLIPLKQAAGRISASIIALYPPGIPFIAPGELISALDVEYIQKTLSGQGLVSGVNQDGTVLVTGE